MKDDINGVVMGNIWYDIIKDGNVLTSYYKKKCCHIISKKK